MGQSSDSSKLEGGARGIGRQAGQVLSIKVGDFGPGWPRPDRARHGTDQTLSGTAHRGLARNIPGFSLLTSHGSLREHITEMKNRLKSRTRNDP